MIKKRINTITEKSIVDIINFIKNQASAINDPLSDQQKIALGDSYLKLSKTIRARENGSIKSVKKSEASRNNGKSPLAGRKLSMIPYTLIDSTGGIYTIEVEKTDRDFSLLSQIIEIQELKKVVIIDRFEC